MALLVAIPTKQDRRQSVRVLRSKDAEPGRLLAPRSCVHAIGGSIENASLTKARRESVRRLHNQKARNGQRCPLHVTNFKFKLQKRHCSKS